LVVVVGHEVKTLSDVRGADDRAAEILRPEGVTLSFQVTRNKVEPSESTFAFNLLSKDPLRFKLANEVEPGGP
jgi:hypothetical protein